MNNKKILLLLHYYVLDLQSMFLLQQETISSFMVHHCFHLTVFKHNLFSVHEVSNFLFCFPLLCLISPALITYPSSLSLCLCAKGSNQATWQTDLSQSSVTPPLCLLIKYSSFLSDSVSFFLLLSHLFTVALKKASLLHDLCYIWRNKLWPWVWAAGHDKWVKQA